MAFQAIKWRVWRLNRRISAKGSVAKLGIQVSGDRFQPSVRKMLCIQVRFAACFGKIAKKGVFSRKRGNTWRVWRINRRAKYGNRGFGG